MTDLLALLKRLEWAPSEEITGEDRCPCCESYRHAGHDPGCELAAALVEVGPNPWGRVTDTVVLDHGQSHNLVLDHPPEAPTALPGAEAPAPHVKVTEVVGQFFDADYDGDGITDDPEAHLDVTGLPDFVPEAATMWVTEKPTIPHGPRGRFKVTVEFTPLPEEGTKP